MSIRCSALLGVTRDGLGGCSWTAEVIIAGWSPSTGNANVAGCLLLAAPNPAGELVYVGDVGTGFTDAARHRVLDLLRQPCSAVDKWRRRSPLVSGMCKILKHHRASNLPQRQHLVDREFVSA